jgi:hypothetical protein
MWPPLPPPAGKARRASSAEFPTRRRVKSPLTRRLVVGASTPRSLASQRWRSQTFGDLLTGIDRTPSVAKSITVTRMTEETLPVLQDRVAKLESRVDQLESETSRMAEVLAALDKMRWDQKKEDF